MSVVQTKDPIDVLKLRVLLAFLNEAPKVCTVTGLAGLLGEGKQRISRILITLEKEGLITRADVRAPRLTTEGRAVAHFFDDRYSTALNHLLYEGVDLDSAEHDALISALYVSDEGMRVIHEAEQCYQAKYHLRKQREFTGSELCSSLVDGAYRLAFLFYRDNLSQGKTISMANRGFEHPCTLKVEGDEGMIHLRPLVIEGRSQATGMLMSGSIRSLSYLWEGEFKSADEQDGAFVIPIQALHFLNIGSGIGQILHGSAIMRMDCSVGTAHMPEATVGFSLFL